MERFGFNFVASILLVSLGEFVGFISSSFVVHRVPRKMGSIYLVLLTCGLGLLFLFGFVKDSEILQTILGSLTRLTCTYASALHTMLTTETFEIKVASNAMGFTMGGGNIGRLLVPFIIGWSNDIGMQPIIASSLFYLVFRLVPVLALKETLKRETSEGKEEEELLL